MTGVSDGYLAECEAEVRRLRASAARDALNLADACGRERDLKAEVERLRAEIAAIERLAPSRTHGSPE